MRKEYEAPEITLIQVSFEEVLSVSSDEVISSQIEGPDPGEEFD